jgi:ubiquinone/menaquinone biosynthesis C-methylase UbiE
MRRNKLDVTEVTRQTYDQIASGYVRSVVNHLVAGSWIRKFEESLLDKFVNLLQRSGDTYIDILDLGCGIGKDTFYLSQKKRVLSTGLDYSSGMLSEARKTYPSIKLVQMDMRKLLFPENCFDGIWANGSIYHIPKKDFQQMLIEVRKVLKTEGIFSFNFKLGTGEQLEHNPKSYGGNPRFYSYYEIEEMKNLAVQANFRIVEVQQYPEEILGEKILQMWVSKS